MRGIVRCGRGELVEVFFNPSRAWGGRRLSRRDATWDVRERCPGDESPG